MKIEPDMQHGDLVNDRFVIVDELHNGRIVAAGLLKSDADQILTALQNDASAAYERGYDNGYSDGANDAHNGDVDWSTV